VSAGDQIHYTLPDINQDGLYRGNVHYDFRSFDWPDWLFLTPNGGLLGTPPVTASSMWLPITVADKNGISSTKSLFLDVKGGTGIGDIEEIKGIKLYPNPVSDIMFIDLGDVKVDHIQVINGVGQVVISQQIQIGQRSLKLDMGSLTEGVYFVRIGDDVRKVVVK
jgi:hypothetical protein